MRLEEIQLKNFGPYQEATIPLAGIESATIGGLNGAGKSLGFIEGVLWCLFGKCRANTDELIRLGETDMAVTVTFTSSGQRYRVTRTRSIRTKKGKSDFQCTVQSGADWQPVERTLSTILNADYDIVTASNFIVQDDPFDLCRAKPSQRIGLLSDILGIARYAEDAKQATRLGNLAEGKLISLTQQVDQRKSEAEAYRQAVKDLEAAEKELTVLNADLARTQSDLDASVKQVAGLEATIQAMPEEDVSYLETQVSMLVMSRDRLEAKIAELTALAEREASLLSKKATLGEIELQVEEVTTKRQALFEEATKADVEVQEAQETINGLIQRSTAIQKQQAGIDVEVVSYRNRLAECERWADRYQEDTEAIKTNIKLAESQIGFLATVPCGEDLQRRCGFTKAAIAIKDEDLPALKVQLGGRETSRVAILDMAPQDRKALEEILAKLAVDHGALTDLAREIDENISGVNLQGKQTAKAKVIGQLQPLEQTLRDLEQQRTTINAQLADLPKVQHAKEALPGVQQDLESKVAELAKAQQAMEHAKTHAARKEDLQRQLTEATGQHDRTKQHLAGLQGMHQECTSKAFQAQATITQTCEAESDLQAIEKQVGELKAAVQQYAWLAEAYKRVPVLMIDNAIPVVEREANLALQQLSAKGMTLRFETQKALKTVDKLVDELNIIVRDQVGERSYETYSGGERGLANFATRLGLSALTSTRSGARLETLIIDEAFASLDSSVTERMRTYLATLPERFPLVLVITHDEGMKGTLGAQIVVSPGPQGSTVEVTA